MVTIDDEKLVYAPFFGYMGAAAAQIFTVFGAAYGTAKSAVGICSIGVMRPELIIKSIIPVVMAGIYKILKKFVCFYVQFYFYLIKFLILIIKQKCKN